MMENKAIEIFIKRDELNTTFNVVKLDDSAATNVLMKLLAMTFEEYKKYVSSNYSVEADLKMEYEE